MIRALCCIAILLSLSGCAGAVVGLGVAASVLTIGKTVYEVRNDYDAQQTPAIKVDHACPSSTPC